MEETRKPQIMSSRAMCRRGEGKEKGKHRRERGEEKKHQKTPNPTLTSLCPLHTEKYRAEGTIVRIRKNFLQTSSTEDPVFELWERGGRGKKGGGGKEVFQGHLTHDTNLESRQKTDEERGGGI